MLKSYDNKTIFPEGEMQAEVKFKDRTLNGRLIVVAQNGRMSLMGRDLMWQLDISIAGINSVESGDIYKLLDRYSVLFDGKLGKYTGPKIHLDVKQGAKPIFRKPHAIPSAFKEQLEIELKKLEKENIMKKVSTSEWGTPLVPFLKPDGSIRICANYKLTVNKYLADHNHPIPRADELFVALQGGEEFLTLDLDRAYNQFDKETKQMLAWSTHMRSFVPNRLSFGTKPACSRFQEIMEKVLQGCEGCKIFSDDIIVTGKNKTEHLKNLEAVLVR